MTEGTNRSEVNTFRPEMYYVAIMDCENEIYNSLGSNMKHKVDFKVGMMD